MTEQIELDPPEGEDAVAPVEPPPQAAAGGGEPEPAGARRAGMPPTWIAAAAALAVVAVVAVLFLVFLRAERVTVPAVAGRDAATAARLVREAGLRVRVAPVRNPQPSGRVVSQSPGALARAGKGSTVVLRISSGPGLTTVPDVRRQSPAGAEATLRGAGLDFTLVRQPSSTVRAGQVAGVTPPADSQVSRGMKVTVAISTGPDRIPTPTVLGLREAAAQRRLARAGLEVVIVRQESPQPAGQVIAQRPLAGQRRRRGGTARIVVAAAPPKVTVPAVSGLDLESAATTLSGLGLRIEFRDRAARRRQKDDTVLTQDPPARSSLARGGTVTLTVAQR